GDRREVKHRGGAHRSRRAQPARRAVLCPPVVLVELRVARCALVHDPAVASYDKDGTGHLPCRHGSAEDAVSALNRAAEHIRRSAGWRSVCDRGAGGEQGRGKENGQPWTYVHAGKLRRRTICGKTTPASAPR